MSEIDLDTAAQNIYTRLSNAPQFHPANANLFTDWNVQAGDVVTVASGNESYSVPICTMKLKWTGQSKVEVESTGNPERKQPPARDRKAYRSASGGYGGQKAINDVLHDAGLFVDPETGVWAYASEQGADYALGATFSVQAGAINAEVTRASTAEGTLSSRLTITEQGLTSKVSAGDISSTINQTAQSVLIQANKINLSGYVTADQLSATNASITNLTTGVTQASILSAVSLIGTRLTVTGSSLELGGTSATWQSASWPSGSGLTNAQYIGYSALSLAHYHTFTVSESGGVVTLDLGAPTSSDPGHQTFDIAATAFYQTGVAAAYERGVEDGSGSISVNDITAAVSGSGHFDGPIYYQPMQLTALHEDAGGSIDILKQLTKDIDLTTVYNRGKNSVTLSGSWGNGNGIYTVTASNSQTENTAISDITLKSMATVSGHLIGTFGIEADGSEVTTRTVNLDSVQSTVNVVKGSWNNNHSITFSPSAGSGSTASVTLTYAGSWGTGDNVNLYSYTVKDGNTTVISGSVDAQSKYTNGYTAGYGVAKIAESWSGSSLTVSKSTTGVTSKTYAISATAGITYNSTAHTYTASAQAKVDGTVRASHSANSGTEAYSAGQSSVTVSGAWSGKKYTATASNGQSVSTGNLALTGSWGTGDNVNLYSYNVKDGTTTILSGSIDAQSKYNAGYSAGYGAAKINEVWTAANNSSNLAISKATTGVASVTHAITAAAGVTYNSTAHTYTASAQAKVDTTARASDTATSGTEAYDAGVASVSVYRVQNASSRLNIYNDSSGSLSVSVYVRLSSQSSGTNYTISVPYRCID